MNGQESEVVKRTKMKKKMVSKRFEMDEEQAARLTRLARRRGVSEASLISESIEKMLAENDNAPSGEAGEEEEKQDERQEREDQDGQEDDGWKERLLSVLDDNECEWEGLEESSAEMRRGWNERLERIRERGFSPAKVRRR
jgi:predicted DNA-binding protein